MNTLYLRTSRDDSSRFARADRRGPLGRGRCYGYDVVLERDPAGERVRGQRQINRHQAANRVPHFRCLRRQKPEECEGVPGTDGGQGGIDAHATIFSEGKECPKGLSLGPRAL